MNMEKIWRKTHERVLTSKVFIHQKLKFSHFFRLKAINLLPNTKNMILTTSILAISVLLYLIIFLPVVI